MAAVASAPQCPPGGLPRPRAEQTTEDDVRDWPQFNRAVLVEGKVVPDTMTLDKAGNYKRPDSTFRKLVTEAGGTGEFPAESGRYWLFVSGVCPWASGCRTVRALLGLEDCIPMEVCDGQSNGGWVMLAGSKCPPWAGRAGPWYAHEAYLMSEADCSTRITMPILFDTKTGQVLNNESSEIMHMLGTVFQPFAKSWIDLYPKQLARDAELLYDGMIYSNLCNGVYRAAFALKGNSQASYEAAKADVFRCLDSLEARLQRNRYLLGAALTYVDVRTVMNLLRFDLSYYHGFGVNDRKISSYPNLSAYLADVYSQIKSEVDWASFYQYFRWGPALPKQAALPSCTSIVAELSKPQQRSGMTVARGQKRHRGVPVPGWFQETAILAFEKLTLRPSDVVFSSVPKAGTHLVKQALLCLLQLGLNGEPPSAEDDWDMKQDGYIEMFPVERNVDGKPPFGHKTFAEVCTDKADPRLMVSHTTPVFGWPDLSASRFVYVMRNPKDACTSLYYMFGVPADGWDGAFTRYVEPDCPNAFGGYFDHVSNIERYVKKCLGGFGGGAAHIVYFEDMVSDPTGQLKKLASFLKVPLSDKKLQACVDRVSFGNMKARKFGAARIDTNFFRKGEVGDWRRHFTVAQNTEFQRVAEQRMHDSEIFAPYLPGGHLHECMVGHGTDTPCWLEADHEEQKAKRAKL